MYLPLELPVKRIEGETLWVVGDLHFELSGFRHDLWEKAKRIIKKDPVVLIGDVIDWGFFDDLRSQMERAKKFEDLSVELLTNLESILDGLNVVLICEGNHDARIVRRVGINPLKYFSLKKNALYVPGMALLIVKTRYKLNSKKHRQYRFVFTHGARGGRRQSAMVNELEDLVRVWAGVDGVIIGHHHRFVHTTFTRNAFVNGNLFLERIEGIAVPSFLSYPVYAQKRGYPPSEHALLKLEFEKSDFRVLKIPV